MGKTRTLQAPERPSLPRVPRPNDSTVRTKTEGPSLTVRKMSTRFSQWEDGAGLAMHEWT
jgi:hypothetical protein